MQRVCACGGQRPAASAAVTIATIPVLTASGRSGHAFTTAARSGDFSDATRLGILKNLAKGPKNVTALCKALGLKQATVSNHLGLLRMGRLVVGTRQGKSVVYTTDKANPHHPILSSHLVQRPGRSHGYVRSAGQSRVGPGPGGCSRTSPTGRVSVHALRLAARRPQERLIFEGKRQDQRQDTAARFVRSCRCRGCAEMSTD